MEARDALHVVTYTSKFPPTPLFCTWAGGGALKPPKNPPVSITDACEAIGIYIEDPKTFDFSKLHIPGTANPSFIILHQVVDAYIILLVLAKVVAIAKGVDFGQGSPTATHIRDTAPPWRSGIPQADSPG
jgi:hypothetical protein